MDTMIYPWGPCLMKQTVTPSIVNNFLKSYKHQSNNELPVPPILRIERRDQFTPKSMEELYPLLSSYVDNYLEAIGMKVPHTLKNMWVNVYKENQSINPHIHTGSDLAFSLYIKTPPEIKKDPIKNAGCIIFTHGDPVGYRSLELKIVEHIIQPEIGDIFIFPSNLKHYTIPFKTPGIERICVSGNISLNVPNEY